MEVVGPVQEAASGAEIDRPGPAEDVEPTVSVTPSEELADAADAGTDEPVGETRAEEPDTEADAGAGDGADGQEDLVAHDAGNGGTAGAPEAPVPAYRAPVLASGPARPLTAQLDAERPDGAAGAGLDEVGQGRPEEGLPGAAEAGPVAEVEDGPAPETAEREPSADPVEAYLAVVEAAERRLDAVDRALARLADGSYGTCRSCGAPIDDADLAADPTLAHCAAHLPLPEPA